MLTDSTPTSHSADWSPGRRPERSALSSLLLLVGTILLGSTVGALLATGAAFLVGLLSGHTTTPDLTALLTSPTRYPGAWNTIMLIQAISHVFTFLVPALVYWTLFEHRRIADFQLRPLHAVGGLSLVAVLVIAFMPLNGLIIEWNQALQLPETLAPLERWMRAKEDELGELTKYLTRFDTPAQLIIALLVIAVLPAIGEEVLFRGVLQRRFIDWLGGNPHVGIWLAAAVFSAIHMQFYGFFPRLLLGALFGYLYVWSGNLWVPILAHFVNNGFTVVMVYLRQRQVVSLDIEDTQSVPVSAALFSLALCLGLMYYFRQSNQSEMLDSRR
ncbi:CPBP family intramembrane glutamic endopeptidase [Rudanella lutea]|uniref:CPBP family intramembrane glutamic endopeptidase n=1 Tax=Rudanella lutea TaxID=451374 RepID=UPI00036C185F|nr:type II CAAX endopeptidase family protein [Rudanella lutea]